MFFAHTMSFNNELDWSIVLSQKLNFLISFFSIFSCSFIFCPPEDDSLGIMQSLPSIYSLPSANLYNIITIPLFLPFSVNSFSFMSFFIAKVSQTWHPSFHYSLYPFIFLMIFTEMFGLLNDVIIFLTIPQLHM